MVQAPVETKVKAATGGAFTVGLVIAFLNYAVGDSQLLGALPAWGQTLAILVVPPLVTFYSGWQARHTPRPDTGYLAPADD